MGTYQSNIYGHLYDSIHTVYTNTNASTHDLQLIEDKTITTRPLVIVTVRGSVTLNDWINNAITQLYPLDNRFVALKDKIADNLDSYISDLSNPIILVTGHSLGAAIANLLAAEFELESVGFDATAFNYNNGYCGYAAHTIGHRKITINNNNTIIGDNNNDINGNVATVINTNGLADSNFPVAGFDNRQIVRNSVESNISVSETDETISEPESNDNSRTLIVVSIRGSVTPLDWAMDLVSQLDREGFNFEAGCQEIITSLNNYLYDNNDKIVGEPIILVTGHSLGAAIANLVAHELNAGVSSDDVYAYTFAIPNTVNIASGDQPIPYTNVFNILNNDDMVPHFPMDILGTEWARHGRDFHITMPLNIDWILWVDTEMLGIAGHGMPNYYAWLNNLPETFGKSAEDITVNDLNEISEDYAVGVVARTFQVLCPVSVTLYDTDGNIVAFESQQEGAIYPEITDSGIVSWIAEDGGKMFLIPYGTEDIEARIEAYDYGTMTLTVEQPGIGEPIDSITYNNVNLFPGRAFDVDLTEITEEVSMDDISLMEVEVNADGTLSGLDNADYHHLLATWAMELSYTAYNYPEGDWLFPIPGLFMGDVDKPATTFLTEHGFENVRDYNYDHDESVAHVVAHKNIMFSSHESEQENTEGELSNGLSSIDIRAVTDNYTSTVLSDNVYHIINYRSDITTNQPDQGLFSSVTSTASSSEGTNTSDTRPLIVVDIRGSVTLYLLNSSI